MTMNIGGSRISLWDVSRLVDELRKGLSPIQSLVYVLIAVVLGSLPAFFPSTPHAWPRVTEAAFLAVSVCGTIAAYVRNGSASGRGFIERMVAISIVVAVRYTVLVAVPCVLLLYLLLAFTVGLTDEPAPLDSFVEVVVFAGYFQRVVHHIGRIPRDAE